MRLVGGTAEAQRYNTVWHVPLCKQLINVCWVDDDTHQYALVTTHGFFLVPEVHQAKKIEIRPKQGLILIDPIEGVSDEDFSGEEEPLTCKDLERTT